MPVCSFISTTRHSILLLSLLTLLAAAASGELPDAPFESPLLAELKHVALSSQQKARVTELIAQYGPRIARAEQEAARTPEQRADRARAVKDAIAQRKRGRQAHALVSASGRLTEEQRQAAVIRHQLCEEFERCVLALLDEEQKEALPELSQVSGGRGEAVIIRLSPDLAQPSDEAHTLEAVARELKLNGVLDLLRDFQINSSRRVVRGIPRDDVIAPAPTRRIELLRRLRSYWRLDVPGQADKIEQIMARLKRLKEIDVAYREWLFTEPEVWPLNDAYSGLQGYLDPAPTGIDARFAWTQPNGEGAGVGLVDLERGWHEDHEDFFYKSPLLVHGDERPVSERHGTAVLGEVIADDNAVGVVGIAPSASYVFLTSYFDRRTNSSNAVAEAILHALPLMYPGDVLLLEVQERSRLLPAEVDEVVFDATELAVTDGMIVVSAAGNGRQDLDAYIDANGKQTLRRQSPDFRDSGAIIVGASDHIDLHNRAGFSNYGSRVDCFAWGRRVVSTGHKGDLNSGGGNVNAAYTKSFNGTSSAAPIIAGAAMLIQGMAQANAARTISPHEMRELLANPATGTPQGPDVPGHIGVMPDLQAIISTHDALVPTSPPDPIRRPRFRRRGAFFRCLRG